MQISLGLYTLAGVSLVLAVSLVGALAFYVRWKRAEKDLLDAELNAETTTAEVTKGELVDVPPPEYKSGGMFGEVGRRISHHWHYKKRRRLLGKGYIQWILLEDGWPVPKFVKPVSEGGGIPVLEHDDTTYLFPMNASLVDEQTGLRTIVHKKGEAGPVNLEVPNELAIRADVLSEYLTNELVSEAPEGGKWILGMDLSGDQLMWLMIIIVVVGSFLYQYLGGSAPI